MSSEVSIVFFDRFSFLKVMFKLKSAGFSIPLYILFFHFTIGAYHLKRAYLLSTLAVVMGILCEWYADRHSKCPHCGQRLQQKDVLYMDAFHCPHYGWDTF